MGQTIIIIIVANDRRNINLDIFTQHLQVNGKRGGNSMQIGEYTKNTYNFTVNQNPVVRDSYQSLILLLQIPF
jgi:hypothetical protein